MEKSKSFFIDIANCLYNKDVRNYLKISAILVKNYIKKFIKNHLLQQYQLPKQLPLPQ